MEVSNIIKKKIFLFLLKNLKKNYLRCFAQKKQENTVETVFDNMAIKPLIFVTAPPGAGKTYNAIQQSLKQAETGKVAILAFHTKNLADQANAELQKQLSLKDSAVQEKVSVVTFTQSEALPKQKLLSVFIKGFVVIVTLHNYLQTMGDTFHHSHFQKFAYFFGNKTVVFVDQSHVFLQQCDQTIPLTAGFTKSFDSNYVITSSKNLMKSKKIKSYGISDPILNLEKLENAENLYSFSLPGKISPQNFTSLFDAEDFRKLSELASVSLENKDFKTRPNIPVHFFSSSSDTKTVSNADGFFPKFSFSEDPIYENPYVIGRQLVMADGDLPFAQVQEKWISLFFKILNHNVIYLLMSALSYEKLIAPFQKKFQKVFSENDMEGFEILIQQQYELFITKFKNRYCDLNFPETQTCIFENLCDKIEAFWKDYHYIVTRCKKLGFYEVENRDLAFFVKLMTSVVHEVITVYPSYNNEKLLSKTEFVKTVTEQKAQKCGQNSEAEEDEDHFSGYGQIIEDETYSDKDESLTSILQNAPTPKISQTIAPPFTTSLNLFDMWSLTLLSSNSVTVFATATPNERHMQNVRLALPNHSTFYEHTKKTQKLDKLFVVFSNVDYFGNVKKTWRDLWEEFGDHFYRTITLPSLQEKNDEGDYALMLLPSEKKTQLFFNRGIKTKSKYFTMISNRHELFDSGYFREGGMQKAKFSCRLASLHSSISSGLNLPNHPFLFVSFNVYKPIFTLFRHKNQTVISGQTLDAYSVLKQGIGRIARKSDFEKQNPQRKANRVLFVSKQNAFPGLLDSFMPDFKKSYEQIEIIDLTIFEREISSVFKRSQGLKVLQEFQSKIPDFKEKYFALDVQNSESFRIFLLKQLIDTLSASKTEFVSFQKQILESYFTLFVLFSTICEISNTVIKTIAENESKTNEEIQNPSSKKQKKNPKGIPTAAALLKRHNPSRKSESFQLIYAILKNDLNFFLKFEKENSFAFFNSLNELDNFQKTYLFFQKIVNLPQISLYLRIQKSKLNL